MAQPEGVLRCSRNAGIRQARFAVSALLRLARYGTPLGLGEDALLRTWLLRRPSPRSACTSGRPGVGAGLSLRQFARRLERAPSYINDVEHDRYVPSEPVLRQICAELGLDEDKLLAAAGRLSEDAEQYIKSNPTAAVLFRKVSGAGMGEHEL